MMKNLGTRGSADEGVRSSGGRVEADGAGARMSVASRVSGTLRAAACRALVASLVGAVLAGAGTASAADLPSALDAAGQLQRLPVEAHAGFGWVRTAGGVVFQVHGITKSVLFYGDGVVRVSAHKGETHTKQPSLVVVTS